MNIDKQLDKLRKDFQDCMTPAEPGYWMYQASAIVVCVLFCSHDLAPNTNGAKKVHSLDVLGVGGLTVQG